MLCFPFKLQEFSSSKEGIEKNGWAKNVHFIFSLKFSLQNYDFPNILPAEMREPLVGRGINKLDVHSEKGEDFTSGSLRWDGQGQCWGWWCVTGRLGTLITESLRKTRA